MAIFYLDASALVKRYRTEAGTDVIQALFAAWATGIVVMSCELVLIEVEATMARAENRAGRAGWL